MFKSIIIWLLKTVFSAFIDEAIEHRKEKENNEENTIERKGE